MHGEAAHSSVIRIAAATLPPIWRERLKNAAVDGTSLSGTLPITADRERHEDLRETDAAEDQRKDETVEIGERRRDAAQPPVGDREQNEADRRLQDADRRARAASRSPSAA